MKRDYTIFFGTKDRNGVPIKHFHSRLASLLREAVRRFNGYSLSPVQGGYVNHKGELIQEPAERLEIETDKDASIREFAKDIKATLHQEEVMVQSHSQE